MSDFGKHFQQQVPAPAAKWGAPAVRVSVSRAGAVIVSVSGALLDEIGAREFETCDLYEGIGPEIGHVVVAFGTDGLYRAPTFGRGQKPSKIIRGWRPKWAPAIAQKAMACRFEAMPARHAIKLVLPDWFDRKPSRIQMARHAVQVPEMT